MAQFFEDHPDLPLPNMRRMDRFGCSKEELAAFAKAAGHVRKHDYNSILTLRREFSGEVVLDYNGDRELVCERVLIGTKIEPEHVIPAQEETVIPEREVPIYEWRCGSIMAPDEVPA